MATAPLDPVEPATCPAFGVRVGAALWSVQLLPSALDTLASQLGSVQLADFEDDQWFQIMDSVRAKAVRLRWYGGGSMTIASEELAASAPQCIGEDGSPVARPRWFEIVALESARRPSLQLVD